MIFDIGILSRAKRAWQYRNDPEQTRVLGTILWRTLLAFALIVLLLALWTGFQEMNAVSDAENVTAPSITPPPPWTPAQLQRALDTLSTKEQQFQASSQSASSTPSDPSK